MKTSLALAFMATFGLMAEANLKHLKPFDIIKPVNPKYTAQEWQEIYAAQKPSPEYYPNFKKGTEPQPEFAGKAHVLVEDKNQRITGGSTAGPPSTACPSHFPWLAALIVDNSYFCSGSLISSQWVLTAAHCARSSYQVILGANQYSGSGSGSLIVTSTTTIIHSQYNEDTMNNDIAVIQLPSSVSFTNYISPVRLRNVPGSLIGEHVLLVGRNVSGVVCFNLTVLNSTECASNIITSTKLCTSTTGSQTTCSGCTGGPLVYKESDGIYTQIGVLSFLAAFTRVSSYLSWIKSNTGIAVGR